MPLIDTHCHLDAAEFDADRDAVVEAARQAGVAGIVVPAVEAANFDAVMALPQRYPGSFPALGIHPMYVMRAVPDDLDDLHDRLDRQRPVAVGEIGLDFFVEGLDPALQERYFVEQLKLARVFELPVLLHVRRSVDQILKYLRRIKVPGGIAHAFNGSRQQADEFIKLGFKLGFGGTLTYDRSRRIRELAATLPLSAIVLETDAPDIPPAWLARGERNSPAYLPRIAAELAALQQQPVQEIIDKTGENALEIMPQMGQLFT